MSQLQFLFLLRQISESCPGTQECTNARCNDFDSAPNQVDCEAKCGWCPLCKLIYVKPGCDFCIDGVKGCEKLCKEYSIVCDKCKKFC